MRKRNKLAFTLIEIMVTLFIIGVIFSIAVPSIIHARMVSEAKQCIKNLQLIDSSVQQWAMDNRISNTGNVPTVADLCGTGITKYLRTTPLCPAGGNYTITDITSDPTCSIGGTGATAHVMH